MDEVTTRSPDAAAVDSSAASRPRLPYAPFPVDLTDRIALPLSLLIGIMTALTVMIMPHCPDALFGCGDPYIELGIGAGAGLLLLYALALWSIRGIPRRAYGRAPWLYAVNALLISSFFWLPSASFGTARFFCLLALILWHTLLLSGARVTKPVTARKLLRAAGRRAMAPVDGIGAMLAVMGFVPTRTAAIAIGVLLLLSVPAVMFMPLILYGASIGGSLGVGLAILPLSIRTIHTIHNVCVGFWGGLLFYGWLFRLRHPR